MVVVAVKRVAGTNIYTPKSLVAYGDLSTNSTTGNDVVV